MFHSDRVKTRDRVTSPELSVVDLNGNQLRLFNSTSKNKTLLFIFSTHCRTCQINIPNWIALTDQINKMKIDIFAISSDSLNLVKKYIDAAPVNFSVYSCLDNQFLEKFKAYLTPQTILIDENNKIVKVWIGLISSFQAYSIINILK